MWRTEEDARVEDNIFELTFTVEMGPLSLETFVIFKKSSLPATLSLAAVTVYNTEELVIEPSLRFPQNRPVPTRREPIAVDNGVIRVTFDPITGSLLTIKDIASGNETEINLTFEYYKSQGSGAYIFYPQGPSVTLYSNIPIIRVVSGPLLTRVEVAFDPYLIHRVTLYSHPALSAQAVHVENVATIHTLKDKEVIMRLGTDISSQGNSYFTDQNGFQFLRRRPHTSLSTEANYYPMTSGAILEDGLTRLTLLSAQSHGVALLERGQLEVMLDRQLMRDDGRGLGEPVEDIKATPSNFVILVERRTTPVTSSRLHMTSLSLSGLVLADALVQPVLVYHSNINSDVFYSTVHPLPRPLPCDVSMVSLRSLSNRNLEYNGTSLILHRRGYDCSFPAPPSLVCTPSDSGVSFSDLFSGFRFSQVKETSLTHTKVHRVVSPTEKLKLAPMELYAYHFRF